MSIKQDYEERWPKLNIKHLILYTADFIVFIDPNFDVDWETTDEYDLHGPTDLEQHNAILNRAASLECIPNDHQKENIRLNFKRMIAEGVARSLNHDYANAGKILDDAEIYIRNRNIETARYWQVTSTCLCGVASAMIILGLWCFRHNLIPFLGSTAFFILIATASGSIGATLSIIIRIGHSSITSEAEKKLHILEAVSKHIGGSISGSIISILIKIGIVVPMFQSINMTDIVMVVGGLIAGASERWVPSLISQFEKGEK